MESPFVKLKQVYLLINSLIINFLIILTRDDFLKVKDEEEEKCC